MTPKEIINKAMLYAALCIAGIFCLVFGLMNVIVTLPWRHK